jgi:hypothetical protein
MALRPVFIPEYDSDLLVATKMIEFPWVSGQLVSEKQQCVSSLHQMTREKFGLSKVLEISTKSEEMLGISLSAFNLSCESKSGRDLAVESLFQSAKKFENGGPFYDLANKSPAEAKGDARLKSSGRLKAFQFQGVTWPLIPQTLFYDWLYLNSLKNRENLSDKLGDYQAFTDIEFNPQRSINCQAYSVAMFQSMRGRGILEKALGSKEDFLTTVQKYSAGSTTHGNEQRSLF